jgi:hypothetical protein
LLCADEENGFQYTLYAKRSVGLERIWAVRQALERRRAVVTGYAVILAAHSAQAGLALVLTMDV